MSMLTLAPAPTIAGPAPDGIYASAPNFSRLGFSCAGNATEKPSAQTPNTHPPIKIFNLMVQSPRGYDFAGGGYFLNNFAIALFRFFETLAGSLPEPNVFDASPRQTCFFWATS